VYVFPLLLFAIAKIEDMVLKKIDYLSLPPPEPKMMIFTAYWFVSTLLFHSYMQEKVPWLVIHILLPMYILAAQMINEIRVNLRRIAIVFCAVLLLYGTLHANFVNPTNPAEPILYMPTTWEARDFAKSVNETYVIFMTNPGEFYPIIWYFAGKYVIISGDADKIPPTNYVVLANETMSKKMIDNGFVPERNLTVRCWSWWTYPHIERVPEFLIYRKPFGDVYCMNFTIFGG